MGSSDGSKRRTRGISASRGSSTSPSRSRTSRPGGVHRLTPFELEHHLGEARIAIASASRAHLG